MQKLSRPFWQGQGTDYASGMNWAFRRIAQTFKSPELQRVLVSIGDDATIPFAVFGAFITGYNLSIAAQCAIGVLK